MNRKIHCKIEELEDVLCMEEGLLPSFCSWFYDLESFGFTLFDWVGFGHVLVQKIEENVFYIRNATHEEVNIINKMKERK